MPDARVRRKPAKTSPMTNIFFYVVFFLVNFLIFIGEVTRKIVLSPIYLILIISRWVIGGVTLLPASINSIFKVFINKLFFMNASFRSIFGKLTKNIKNTKPKRGRGRPRKQLVMVARYLHFQHKVTGFLKKGFKKIVYTFVSLKNIRFGPKRGRGRPPKNKKIAIIPKINAPQLKNPFSSLKLPTLPSFTTKLSYIFLGSFLTLLVLFIYQSYLFAKSLPSPYSIGKVNYPLSTHIYDRKGKLLYEVYREQNRTPVELDQLPKYVEEATIAIEDKDFYKHKGVSLFSGVLRATKEIILNNKLQGGSTITQQLVKTALLTPERTLQRKVKEIILAVWAESIYDKETIIQMYLNQVPYGGQAYGIQGAAQTYFGKSADKLTLEEAALLAGLPQAPSLYSPYVNPRLAVSRRNDVLESMYEQGYIDKNSKLKAQNSKLNVAQLRTEINAPHFVFYVKGELEKQYGIRAVEEGGFRVTTTLDLNIQRETEKILREELEKIPHLNVTNGAVLVTKPATGEIIAMVGSVDYWKQPYGAFNVTTSLRQPGSSGKPFLYAMALERGFTAASTLDDTPTTFGIAGSEPYRPVNYDGKFRGRVPFRYALANSYNIPAVKLLNAVGVFEYAEYAKRIGIGTWGDSSRYGLSMSLGGLEVTMIDMNTAYGVFANQGYRVDLNNVLKLEDSKGEELYTIDPYKTKVVDEGAAYILSDILSDNAARVQAFGPGSQLEIPGYKVSVKTGTTDNKLDNWTCGYTPEFTVCVWVGNNDNSPMNPYLASGVTGAAPIWHRTMEYLLKNHGTKVWYQKPANVVERQCYGGRPELFLAGTENTVPCRELPTANNQNNEDDDNDRRYNNGRRNIN